MSCVLSDHSNGFTCIFTGQNFTTTLQLHYGVISRNMFIRDGQNTDLDATMVTYELLPYGGVSRVDRVTLTCQRYLYLGVFHVDICVK